MKVFVLGGDGFCGWPIALHLSARGDDVTIVDNLSRRRLDRELAVGSLTPLAPFKDKLAGRSMIVKKAQPLAIECVVRGYLAGSGWKSGDIGCYRGDHLRQKFSRRAAEARRKNFAKFSRS